MNNFKKAVLALSICSATLITTNANAAGWPVSDIDLLSYLSNSAAGGVVTDNGGVISLLNSITTQLDSIKEQNKQLATGTTNSDSLLNQLDLQNKAALSRTPDANACYSATSTGAGGGAAGNTASGSAGAAKAAVQNIINADSPAPETKNFALERVQHGFCSDLDVKYNVGGCTAVGTYPAGDVDGGALSGAPFTAAQQVTDAVRPDTYTADQAEKIQTLVKNATANIAPEDIKDKGAANTATGIAYKTMLSSYQAKATLAQAVVNDQVALRTEMKTMSTTQQNAWGNYSPHWQEFFGSATPTPPKPSEYDLLNGAVASRYAYEKWQTDVGTMNEIDAAREQNRQLALTNKLIFMMLNEQMKANQLLASQLGQQIQPVNYNQLNQIKDQITRN